jgi:glycerol-3-phosphate dehydrogenase
MTGHVDVVVIGAGIQGAGCAQALSAAGHSVLVLEKTGIAAATSCRSSKLIHGGLRYLETGQFSLVRESLRERDILLRIAPGLVRLVPFHIPVYRDTSRHRVTIRTGLALYAVLDNLHRSSWFSSVPRRHWGALDGLTTDGLKVVYRYQDAQTDDAKLTQAVMHSAQALGAVLTCPAEFLAAVRTSTGFEVRFRSTRGEQHCQTQALVNATGPWVNETLTRIAPLPLLPDIELVQGTHIVFDGPLQQGVYYTEAEDRRAVFVMPWRSMTLVGTTETRFHGNPAEAQPQPQELEYLKRTMRRYFPNRDLQQRDAFAGLRVLPRGTGAAFTRPRETLFMTDEAIRPRLVSVVGGKLTGYRATAARVAAILSATLPTRPQRADTARLELNP